MFSLYKERILSCHECDLRQQANAPVPGIGPSLEKIQLIIVGQNPGIEEDTAGKPFIGRSGELLRNAFKYHGFKLDEIAYICNACCCHSSNNTEPSKKQLKACFSILHDTLQTLKNVKFVLLLGRPALQTLFPKLQITKQRGQLLDHPDYPDKKFISTFHPAKILRDPSFAEYFDSDISILCGFIKNGIPEAATVSYSIETIHDRVCLALEMLESKPIISFDIETSGLDPFKKDSFISMISFSWAAGKAVVIPIEFPDKQIPSIAPRNLQRLRNLLSNPKVKKIAHNAVFDMKWIKAKFGVEVEGLVFDTMYGAYLLSCGERIMPSLKDLAAEFTDMGHYEDELLRISGLKAKTSELFTSVPFDVLGKYCAKDADATFRLFKIFYPQLKDTARFRLLGRVMKASKCLMDMELEGWPLRAKVVKKIDAAFKSYLADLEGKIRTLPSVIRYEKVNGKLNIRSNDQKSVLLSKYEHLPLSKVTKKGKLAVDQLVILEFAPQSPLCKYLYQYTKIQKLSSTYTTKILARASDDGRLRTQYNLTGTHSGRLSSSNPNLQNQPRAATPAGKLIKKMFEAPSGYTLLECDLSQVELRIMATYCQDPIMLEAYTEGYDLHRKTAAFIYGIKESEVTPEQRFVGKTCNFALIYGISPNRLRQTIFKDTKIMLSRHEAEMLHGRFFMRYNAITAYHRRVERFVLEHGFIDTRYGRRRNFLAAQTADAFQQSEAFRQAYNHCIQGTVSDMLFEALIKIRIKINEFDNPPKLIATVHDSVLLFAPTPIVDKTARVVKACMEDFHYDWLIVPIKAEVKTGKNWGSLQDYFIKE